LVAPSSSPATITVIITIAAIYTGDVDKRGERFSFTWAACSYLRQPQPRPSRASIPALSSLGGGPAWRNHRTDDLMHARRVM
jgi:hypothetical protein